MYFEVYADMLLLLNLCFNTYLLIIVNVMLHHTASVKRILIGAAGGAAISVVSALVIGMGMLGSGIGFGLAVAIMCLYTFRVRGFSQWWKVLEKMAAATLLLGGSLLMLRRLLPFVFQMSGMIGVLVPGAVGCMFISERIRRSREKEKDCYVIVAKDKERVRIRALMDTGNLLREPISQKPVAVVDEPTLMLLFDGKLPEGYRIIPYQSVGKRKGVLKGYYLKQLVVEWDGIIGNYSGVYVATGEEFCGKAGGYQVILSPDILERKGEEKDDVFENVFAGGNWGESMVSEEKG